MRTDVCATSCWRNAAVCACLLAGAASLDCHGDDRDNRYSRAVPHLMAIGRPSEIPEEFEKDYRKVEQGSLQRCNEEGLSEPQLDCILRVKTMEDLARLRACPAIAGRVPTWIHVPAPEDLPPSLQLDAGP